MYTERIMSDSEGSTSTGSGHKPLHPPLARTIHLEELEQTVPGIVKKTFKQFTKQSAWEQSKLPGSQVWCGYKLREWESPLASP